MLSTDWSDRLIFTGRGSTAIGVLLQSLEQTTGHVLVPANVCEVVIATIKHIGFEPKYADVDEHSGNSELKHFVEAYDPLVRAVIAVPNFGRAIDMEAIAEWTRSKGIFLIEDLCNALATKQGGRYMGGVGDAAVYSFGYAKVVEHGIGGAIVLHQNDRRRRVIELSEALPTYSTSIKSAEKQLNEELVKLRSKPRSDDYLRYRSLYADFAPNLLFKLDESRSQALRQTLTQHDLEANVAHRMANSTIYQSITHPKMSHRKLDEGEVPWRYTMLAESVEFRDQLVRAIRSAGFLVSTWYPSVADLFEKPSVGDHFPHARKFGDRVINFFVDHRISQEMARDTVSFINSYSVT